VHTLGARLKSAAVSIRAATDLLRTHTSPDGRWQTPESPAFDDPTARLIALERVAHLVIGLTYARPALSQAARLDNTVMPWMRQHRLPELSKVRGFARELRSLTPTQAGTSVIDSATVANPGIRHGEPVIELLDRIDRMRVTAWRAAVYPSVETGIPTLIDFATAAVFLHGRAAILAARAAGFIVRDPRAPAEVKFLVHRADHWRGARKRLLHLLSPSVSDPMLADDVRALRDLLGDLTSRGTTYHGHAGADPRFTGIVDADQLTAAMHHATGTFEAIAASNAITIRVLHTAGLLQTPGKLLVGEKKGPTTGQRIPTFTHTAVPVPTEHVSNILKSYGAVHSGYTTGIPDAFQTPRGPATEDFSAGL
jgi:hypothetical protein